MKLSIIIPVFNEEKTIAKVIDNVYSVNFDNLTREIIIVDDGSSDKSLNEIKRAITGKKDITLIEQGRNQGKGAAVASGIKEASGDYIIIQDADFEYDPNQIKELVKPILENRAKVVYGTRLNRRPHLSEEEKRARFLLHYFGNRFLSLVTSVLYGAWITDMETCYKLFPAKIGKSFKLRSKRFDFEPEITAKLLKSGYKILELPITTKPRGYDEGKKLRTFHDGSIALWTLLKYRFTN